MKKPEKPIPSECCGQGCTPCVYERYAYKMEVYKEWLKEGNKDLRVCSRKSEINED